jgi:hypothetical protein
MDKGHMYLHNHPMTEKRLGLDDKHVIVDSDAWKHARRQGLNLPIQHVSNRRKLLIAFCEWFNEKDKTQSIIIKRVDEFLKSNL